MSQLSSQLCVFILTFYQKSFLPHYDISKVVDLILFECFMLCHIFTDAQMGPLFGQWELLIGSWRSSPKQAKTLVLAWAKLRINLCVSASPIWCRQETQGSWNLATGELEVTKVLLSCLMSRGFRKRCMLWVGEQPSPSDICIILMNALNLVLMMKCKYCFKKLWLENCHNIIKQLSSN